jgi:V8-like Glu-specific endopeptidase
MRMLYVGALAAAALAAIPSRAIITNGSPNSSDSSWDGVGLLEPNNTQVYSPATGVLIDSLHVLTAAHAVYDSQTGGAISPSIMTFELGSSSYDISSISIDPNFTGGDQYDIAVLTLSKSTPATGHTTYAYNTPSLISNETGNTATLVGYGFGGTGSGGQDPTHYPIGTQRAGINAIDQNTDSNRTVPNVVGGGTEQLAPGLLVFDFDQVGAGNGPLGGPALGTSEADTTDGDSGGPMFEYDSALGKYVVVGISTNGEDANPEYGDIGWGTRVSDYDSFIASEVPEPVGLVPAAIGMIFALKRRGKSEI